MLASQENVYLTILHALTVSNESEKARSTPVSTVLRKSVTSFIISIFLIQKTLSKLKSGKWCGHFFFFFTIFKASFEENGTSQYRF